MPSLKEMVPLYIKDFIHFENKFLELDYSSKLDDAKLQESSLGMANMIIDIGSSIESISKELHQYLYEQDNSIRPAYRDQENFDYHAFAALDHILVLSEKKLEFNTDFIHSNEHQQIQPLKYAHFGDKCIEELVKIHKLPENVKRPDWCQVYPKLRHDRLNNIDCGTAFNAIDALGALFILLTYTQYIVNTPLPLSYDTAPELQKSTLLEPIFSSYLFKPTTCRPIINNFTDDMNNSSLSNLEILPEAMFVIKDSVDFVKTIRFHQIDADLTVRSILSKDAGFCNYIHNNPDLKNQSLPILIHNYANNIKHDPEWGKKLNDMLFSLYGNYFTLCANSFSKNQVNNSKLWPEVFLNIFCYKEVIGTIKIKIGKNNIKIYDTSEVKYRDIYNYSLINQISKDSIIQQIEQGSSHIKQTS